MVVAGGDVGFGRSVGTKVLNVPGYDPFEHVRPLFEAADLTFVNLESQLAERGRQTVHPQNPLVFVGPPTSAPLLKQAGVDVVSLANNHAWDFGRSAFEETLGHLKHEGIAHAGATAERGQAYEPTIVRRRGWSVAIFAVTQIWNVPDFHQHPGRHHVAWANYGRLATRVEQARAEHDVVLVSYHGGGEYIDVPLDYTRAFFRMVADLGVDAVLGHHPHVTQGVGWRKDRPLVYSLGNLVFEPFYTDWTRHGLLARLTFERGKGAASLALDLCPIEIRRHQTPSPLPTHLQGDALREALQLVRSRLVETSAKVGGSTVSQPGPDGCMRVEPPKATSGG